MFACHSKHQFVRSDNYITPALVVKWLISFAIPLCTLPSCKDDMWRMPRPPAQMQTATLPVQVMHTFVTSAKIKRTCNCWFLVVKLASWLLTWANFACKTATRQVRANVTPQDIHHTCGLSARLPGHCTSMQYKRHQ